MPAPDARSSIGDLIIHNRIACKGRFLLRVRTLLDQEFEPRPSLSFSR